MGTAKPTIKLIQGATLRRVLRTPWNLTNYTVTCQLRDEHGNGMVKGTFTTTLQTNPQTGLLGQIELLTQVAGYVEMGDYCDRGAGERVEVAK
ncbi:hypothetical protein AB3R30_19780, partial [Leptolyngbyaceae cyanobacterium UHCC 1019]